MRVLLVTVIAACDFTPRVAQSVVDAQDPQAGDAADASRDAPPAVDCFASWKTGPLILSAPALVANVNSPEDDRDPFISNNNRELAIVSRRPGNQNGDVYVARRTSTTVDFDTPVRDDAVSSGDADSRLSVSGDELQRVLATTRSPSAGNFDIFIATRTDPTAAFGPFAPTATALVNTGGSELDPELSFDALTLYLAIETGQGQAIAAASRLAANAAFTAPVSIIASGDGDADPALSPDELVILFSSNRLGGVGGADLWYATRPDRQSAFGTAINLGAINSTDGDGDATLSRDGCTLYFASDRSGNYDIYVSTVMR